MAEGRVELPPKPGIHPRENAFIHAMPAYLCDDDVAAIKWVSGYPSNQALGLPYITGLMIVNDAATGIARAVMDAGEITAVRTAAASGVCIRHYAPSGWSRAAVLGFGEQGRAHHSVLRALNPAATVAVFDPDPGRVASLPAGAVAAASAREAAEGAGIVITAGPIVESPQPVVVREWLATPCLVLPLDFDCMVAADVIETSGLFLSDDLEQYRYYRGRGHFGAWGDPSASVGEALLRDTSAAEVVCCNLGVGALDAAVAAAVLRAAEARGAGTELAR
jgi:alanine dehydrogenase